jgi:hypothetical protein
MLISNYIGNSLSFNFYRNVRSAILYLSMFIRTVKVLKSNNCGAKGK